jgi:hypothetical protein
MSERPETTGRQRAYEEFMDPGSLPPGADLPRAEARLLEALEREAGVPLVPDPDPGIARARRTEAPALDAEMSGGLGGRIARWLGAPRLRPAFALAVVLVAAIGVWTQVGPRREGEPPLLRGPAGSTTETPGAWGAQPQATLLGDGRARLAWTPAPEATGYAVVFLTDDLHEIARVGDLEATTLVLDREALPAGLASGQVVLWRVTAYAGADELARSPASTLSIP